MLCLISYALRIPKTGEMFSLILARAQLTQVTVLSAGNMQRSQGILIIFIFCFLTSGAKKRHRTLTKKPHIILILADDLGWNEVSWHNNRIKTPHLEVRLIFWETNSETI